MKKIIRNLLTLILLCIIYFGFSKSQTWTRIYPQFSTGDTSVDLSYCAFATKNIGWIGENKYDSLFNMHNKIYKTTNGGNYWFLQNELINANYFTSSFAYDSLKCWFIGGLGGRGMLLLTNDGGHYWDSIRVALHYNCCLIFFDSLNGFAGGEDSIYSTTDGGVSWQAQTIEPGVRFGIWDIYFVDKNNGWAVGGSSTAWDAGIILNTTDGGKYWRVNLHPSGVTGKAVYFTDSLHGYVVGSNPPFFQGLIYVTSNGGAAWKHHYLPGTWLNDVVFTDDSTGWVVGKYGFIWHTTDKGLSWNRVESGTTSHLYRIFFFDDGKLGYIFGGNSTLLKYDKTVGVKEENSFKELSFKLYQNYPNPFNSQTEIDFTIPNREMVKIEVYDVLGRKLKTLVSEFLEPGKHKVSFDASGMTSGVYYYSIITESRRTTKKMLLIQ